MNNFIQGSTVPYRGTGPHGVDELMHEFLPGILGQEPHPGKASSQQAGQRIWNLGNVHQVRKKAGSNLDT
jgi:hypothetical protein